MLHFDQNKLLLHFLVECVKSDCSLDFLFHFRMKENEIPEIPEEGNFQIFYKLQKLPSKEATDRASSSSGINHCKVLKIIAP